MNLSSITVSRGTLLLIVAIVAAITTLTALHDTVPDILQAALAAVITGHFAVITPPAPPAA